ncbi:MAG: tetratricopeptide repeat protein [Deltaproteobacteria bacterium]|nr:tetratricopeptide repeat protein [Deltaproteobacteria bacterium]
MIAAAGRRTRRLVAALALALALPAGALAASPEDVRRDLIEADELMESARTLIAKGEGKASKKRLEEAEALYEKILADNAEQRDAAVGLSAVYFLQKRYDAGVALMRPFSERLPDDQDVAHQLGMHLYRAGQHGFAVPLLERVAADPQRFDAAWMLALHYYRQGDWALGLPHAERYHAARPDDVESLALIGTYYLKAERHDRAVTVLDRYLAAHPDNVAARINRANALFRQGRLDDAGQEYEALLAKFPDRGRFLYNLAAVRIKQDRCADALPLLDRFLAREPKNGPGLYFRADCLLKLKRWDDAKAAFAKAGTQGPQNPWVYYGLSRVALENGDHPGAITNAKKAVEVGATEPEILAWLGTLHRRLEQAHAEALAWHDKAVAIDGDEAAWHVERGRDLWGLDRVDDARGAFDRARGLDAESPGAREGAAAARTSEAVAAFTAGDATRAEATLVEALAIAPGYQPARANLAIVQVARGDGAAARATLAGAPSDGAAGADLLAATALVRLVSEDLDGAAEATARARAAGTTMIALVAEVEGHVAARRQSWDQAARAFEESAAIRTRPALEQARAQAWLELGLERLGRGDGAARDALGRASRGKTLLDKDDQSTIEFALQCLNVVVADNGEQAAKNLAATLQGPKYAGGNWARVRDIGWGYAAYGFLKSRNAAEARRMLERVRDRAALGNAWDALANAADDVEARRAFQGGDYAGAERIWAQMVARGVEDPGVKNNLGAARFMLGKATEAEALWRPLADAGAPAEALYNLGNALGRKGEHRASWDLLRRYVRTGGAAAALSGRVETKARLFGFQEVGP